MPEHVLLTLPATHGDPLRREPQINEEIRLQGLSPLRLFNTDRHGGVTKYDVQFEGRVIGTAGVRYHSGIALQGGVPQAPRHDVIVTLDTIVPERVVEPILSRMRAFARDVHRMHNEKRAEEQRVMDDMLAIIGPIDHPKVRVPYAPGAGGMSALTFPGILEDVLGPNFSFKPEHTPERAEVLMFHYEDAGISYPAFRITAGWGGNTEIRGRGDRERAREGFVSDAMERALARAHEIVQDPDMRNAAARLPASRKPWSELKSYYERVSEHETFPNNRTCICRKPNNRMPIATEHFGDGFEAVVYSDYNGEFELRYEGMVLRSCHDGFLPGIPEDLRARIYETGVLTLVDRRPEFRQRNNDLLETVGRVEPVAEPEEDTLAPRLLAAFGMGEMEP